MVEQSEKMQMRMDDLVRRHLEPLDLPASTISSIFNTIQREPTKLKHIISKLESFADNTSLPSHSLKPSPITSGLSISLGYAVGGTIPLLPYFFASTVGFALQVSCILCLVVLFAFGVGKRWILSSGGESLSLCLVEGLQMLVLGAVAAGAAVMCVAWVAAR
jgi:VIT1/CCC1 family predicted Fe2+/Mn2+ transporter